MRKYFPLFVYPLFIIVLMSQICGGADDSTAELTHPESPEVVPQIGHTSSVISVAFSPDGRLLASGSYDKTIRLWSVADGRGLRALTGHTAYVRSVAFSPDGKLLASGSGVDFPIRSVDNTVKLWSVAEGHEVRTLTGHTSSVRSIAFSPDGRLLASGGDDETIRLWSVADGREVRTLTGHTSSVVSIAFSPDGRLLASGSYDKTIRLWSVADGREVRALTGHTSSVRSIAFSPDGRLLVSGGDDETIRLWSVADGREVRTLTSHTSSVYSVAFSPDGKLLASGSGDNTVKLWSVADGREVRALRGYTNWVPSIAFSPDGKLLASGSGEAFRSGDTTVKLWSVADGREVRTLTGHTSSVVSIAFSPDGRLLASGSWDNTVKLWSVADGREVRTLTGHTDQVSSIAFSPDGRLLASGSVDTTVKLWSVADGREVRTLTGHTDYVLSVAFSPDGRLLASGSGDTTVKLWSVADGREVRTLTGHTSAVGPVAFSPDGRLLTSGRGDTTVKLWSVADGREVRTLTGHTDYVRSVAFSPDGKLLAGACEDGSVRIRDANTGDQMISLSIMVGKDGWLAFSPDGFFDGTRAAWQLVPFRFPSEPMKMFEPEQFFNQFYQPGLLADIFREGKGIREILKGRRDPRADLEISKYRNCKLPEVKIVNPKDGFKTEEREIQVTVEAKDTGCGIRDLRVFRNQALVHFEHGELKSDTSTKIYRLTVPVPVKLVSGVNEISAYAFNKDNLKSKDATITVTGADSLKRKGTAYILAVGVNRYSNTDWNLNFAVNDAQGISETLGQSFTKFNTYTLVVPVTLMNEAATKANLLSALGLLSGAITSLPSGAPEEFKKLRRAEPEDDIIVYFSGHGMADKDRYYLIPHDMGYEKKKADLDKPGREIIIKHSLSDQDLNKGFEKIDAGRMMLIIDACQSGQALEAEEKRRGPMNSRGLAQLAYEKGMYILAAAQSHEAALEFERLGHGLLTYVLIEEGLKKLGADTSPKDGQVTAEEWLDYATQHAGREVEGARTQYAKKKGGEQIDGGEVTVTGQSPRAYYRRERMGDAWVVIRR